jgi:hypothetical protein
VVVFIFSGLLVRWSLKKKLNYLKLSDCGLATIKILEPYT